MNTAKEWQKEKMEEAVRLWEGKSEASGECEWRVGEWSVMSD